MQLAHTVCGFMLAVTSNNNYYQSKPEVHTKDKSSYTCRLKEGEYSTPLYSLLLRDMTFNIITFHTLWVWLYNIIFSLLARHCSYVCVAVTVANRVCHSVWWLCTKVNNCWLERWIYLEVSSRSCFKDPESWRFEVDWIWFSWSIIRCGKYRRIVCAGSSDLCSSHMDIPGQLLGKVTLPHQDSPQPEVKTELVGMCMDWVCFWPHQLFSF